MFLRRPLLLHKKYRASDEISHCLMCKHEALSSGSELSGVVCNMSRGRKETPRREGPWNLLATNLAQLLSLFSEGFCLKK